MEGTTAITDPQSSTPLFSVLVSGVVCIECIAAILLNTLTISAIVICGLGKRSATHLFIASLSVSDLLSGVNILCFQVQRWLVDWIGSNSGLAATSWLNAVLAGIALPSSLQTSLVIGIDRALATSKPIKYKTLMSLRNAKLIILFQWILASVMVCIPAIYKYIGLDAAQRNKMIVQPPEIFPDSFNRHVALPMTYLNVTSITLLYIKVFLSYKKAIGKIEVSADPVISRKLTRTAMIVTTLLIICWTPLAVVSSLPVPDQDTQAFIAYTAAYKCVFIFLLLPAYLNNIIYALQHKDYKRAYMKVLGFKLG
ncbi:hypothetical protein CAPTEDRAFT_198496 [Capitella teleta]|uniref:G-protein coupled receptors family 1 profile domain-containing protein n=1 Tax=Capitella teleta TaxID=283909 RepID=R7ULM0_CAPTE|nr:hypothetical protein CAPTEDRAFT_198496 [Capitella teleta]|eukprot:ELU04837.1 hypothetical protein CAPTEDRAFT_198496 [Capitella teleta]